MNVKNDDDEIKLLCEDRLLIKYLQILLFLHATYTNYYYIIIISIIVREKKKLLILIIIIIT